MKTSNPRHLADRDVPSEGDRFEALLHEPTLEWREPDPGGTVLGALGGSVVALAVGPAASDEEADLAGVAG